MALNLKGFVLLELMIGLSILAIIISASYQVITGLDQYNQALNNHESKVITTMNQVQREWVVNHQQSSNNSGLRDFSNRFPGGEYGFEK